MLFPGDGGAGVLRMCVEGEPEISGSCVIKTADKCFNIFNSYSPSMIFTHFVLKITQPTRLHYLNIKTAFVLFLKLELTPRIINNE